MVAIVVISGIGLLGFAAVITGLARPVVSAVEEAVAGIEWPQWLPLTPSDSVPPSISNVEVSDVTETSAVVTWETDEPATSQVMVCDPDGLCTWTEQDTTLAIPHSVSLSDLKPNTPYHYTVISIDAEENEATREGELTTSAQGDTTPPVISGVDVSDRSESSAAINWTTDEPATSLVEYGTTDAYGSTTSLDEELTTSHSVTISGLKPRTTYHFIVRSQDGSGNEVISETDQTFTTLSALPVDLEEGPEMGMLAPDFTLPTIDGKQLTLSDFRGQIVMVYFWEAGHLSCRREIIDIKEVIDEWSNDGKELAILAIHLGQITTEWQDFVYNTQWPFPILLDLQGKVGSDYQHRPFYTAFFIDADGIIDMIIYSPSKAHQEVKSVLESP